MPFTSSFNGSFTGGRRSSTDSFGANTSTLRLKNCIVHYDASNNSSYGGSGTTFTDITSNANNGTIVGGPTFDTDKFTWTSGDYIVTPDIADHITSLNKNHTVEVWCRPTDDGVVVTYAGQADPTTGYHFSAIEIVDSTVEFGMWTGSGITSSGPTETLTLGQWYQLTLTYRGTVVRGYVNGRQVCKFNATWDPPMDSTGALYMAAGTSDITNQGDGTTFDGDIRVIRVYGHPLRRNDIKKNLAKGRGNDNVTPSSTTNSFTTAESTTWTAPLGVKSVEYLVVGGGAGGGNGYDTGGGGGGSAGVVLTGTKKVRPNRIYDIVVGAGGAGGADTRANRNGSDGSDSTFASITASGGDAGNGSRTVQRSHSDGGDAQAGSTVGQGGDGGGNASSPGGGSGGGGGGAGGAGSNGSSGVGGAGGAGTSSSISGSAVTYGAGGAGARGNFNTTEGANGSANTGNGGGGGGAASGNSGGGGTGGSGIVILKYGTVAWDPANDITPAYWLDASDTSSYTLSSSTLNTVTDKAGNFTVTIDGTPTRISSSLNSLNVWDFDGSESLITGTGPYTSSGNHWAIGVFQYHATDSTKDSFFSADGTRTYAVSSSQSNNTWTGEIDYDGSNSIVTGTAKNDFTTSISINTWVIVSIVFNKTGNQIFGRINGTTATSTDAYNLAMDTTATDVRMMRNRAGVKLDGQMAEYFHIAGAPGTGGTDITDVQKAEGYLAHKWGLESNLPADHPYRYSAPTV